MKKQEMNRELRGLTAEQAVVKARELAGDYLKARFRKAAGQLTRTHELKQLRRNIARALTAARSSNIAGAAKNP